MIGLFVLILWIVVLVRALVLWVKDPAIFKKQQHQSFFQNSSSCSQATSGWSNNSIFSDNHQHQPSFLNNDYLTNPNNPMNPSFGQCGTLNSSSPNYIWQDFGK
jgi:hypothetical protein